MDKKQLRAAKVAEQQTLLDGANSASRDMTADEQARFNVLQTEIETLNNEIQDEENAKAIEDAKAEERSRISGITTLCKSFDLDETEYVKSGMSIEDVNKAVLETLQKQKESQPSTMHVTRDAHDNFRAQASDAILMRAGKTLKNPVEGAKELQGMSLVDLARECMTIQGQDNVYRMSSEEVFNRAFYNPTSAFPAIMDQTIEKSIVQEYQEVGTTFERITTEGTLKDFKQNPDHEYVIGGLSAFEEVPENGEIKADLPRTELLPQRQLHTYGKQFTMTRQAFINDDIGFLTTVPGLYAARAKETIDEQVYQILFDNATIFDGTPLFSDDHANLMSAASKPTQESIQAALMKLQLQKDQFGKAITVVPKAIVVPVGYGFDLQVIFQSAQIVGSVNNDINPLYNYSIDIVESPVLNVLAGENACPWFIVAQPISAKGIQVDYLNGQKTPTVRRMEIPGTLGFVWDIYMDWGVSVRDFRGLVMNPGVALEKV